MSAEIIEEQWDGQTYHLKAKLVVDPDRVVRIVDEIRRDRQKTRELEKLKKIASAAMEELEMLRSRQNMDQENGQADPGRYQKNIRTLRATIGLNEVPC